MTSLAPLQPFSGAFLQYALVFLMLAILAAVAGRRGVAGISFRVAKLLVIVFLVLAVVSIAL
jgi:uncharacterized membrane protein YtjA (UPF0391 family)